MRKLLVIGLAMQLAGLGLASTARADEQAQRVMDAIKAQLWSRGVKATEFDQIKQPVEEMLLNGAGPAEVTKAVTELTFGGYRGDDLKNSLDAMNDMVKNGVPAREAGLMITQLSRQGLRGKDLSERVKAMAKIQESMHQARKPVQKTGN